MACVDILSQLDTFEDDPFANWIKFEDDVDPFPASFNNNYNDNNNPIDIFQFLEQNNENEEPSHNRVNTTLLDFNKISNIPLVFKPKSSSPSKDIISKYKKSPSISTSMTQKVKTDESKYDGLTLNIIGLNASTLNSKSEMKQQETEIIELKEEKFKCYEISTNLTIDNTVSDLKKCICNKYKIDNDKVELLIIYSHSVLFNNETTLKSYGINENSSLFIAICENYDRFNSFVAKKYIDDNESKLNFIDELFGFDEIVKQESKYHKFTQKQSEINAILSKSQFKCTKMSDLDIFTYEISTDCIKMPCGHGIPAQSLYFYTKSEFESNNKLFIECPHFLANDKSQKCGATWYWPIIHQILDESKEFTLSQIMKLELLSSYNTFKRYYSNAKCPTCINHIYRHCDDDKNRRLSHCPYCKYNNSFCWKCHEKWKDSTSQIYCGNDECANFEMEYYEIISKCETKTIGHVHNIPTIRACPQCSQLIYHTEACKHMNCSRCKTNFCFVCLKPELDGDWQCGNSSTICPVAPRQIDVFESPNKKKKKKKKEKNKQDEALADVSVWGDWY